MGRGRLEIKKIENPTNRQVTYSKRRLGIMKKAKELTVLCDAQVSVIMFSSTGKFADYCSPSTNTKRIVDLYQQATGVDLWKDQYEKMQSTLRNLEEINCNLRKEIRQRMGEDLDGLSFMELRGLEQSLDETLMHVRQRKSFCRERARTRISLIKTPYYERYLENKSSTISEQNCMMDPFSYRQNTVSKIILHLMYHMISTQTDTYKKKLKSTHEAHRSLLRELEMKDENQDYRFLAEGALSIANDGTHMFAFRVQPSQPNLLGLGYGPHDLSLA